MIAAAFVRIGLHDPAATGGVRLVDASLLDEVIVPVRPDVLRLSSPGPRPIRCAGPRRAPRSWRGRASSRSGSVPPVSAVFSPTMSSDIPHLIPVAADGVLCDEFARLLDLHAPQHRDGAPRVDLPGLEHHCRRTRHFGQQPDAGGVVVGARLLHVRGIDEAFLRAPPRRESRPSACVRGRFSNTVLVTTCARTGPRASAALSVSRAASDTIDREDSRGGVVRDCWLKLDRGAVLLLLVVRRQPLPEQHAHCAPRGGALYQSGRTGVTPAPRGRRGRRFAVDNLAAARPPVRVLRRCRRRR